MAVDPLAQKRGHTDPPEESGADPSVTRIGRFEIVEKLGTGSMGVVYLARDPMIGRWVAVKKLTGIKGKDLDPETVRRLLIHEARNVGSLEHPGILTVFDIVEDRDGRVEALAMEYVGGKSLRQRLDDAEPLSLKRISEIITAVSDALDYAHECGCVHRDVKPANVLLGNDGAIKIADFGIAALRGEDLATELRNLGTPNYLAPERVMGDPGDGRADVYSLGVILYELLTRRLPFEASSIAELVQKIVQEKPTPPEQFAPNLMLRLREVLERAIAKEPDDRYQTAGALAAAVREAVEAQAALNDTVPAPLSLLPELGTGPQPAVPPRPAAKPAAASPPPAPPAPPKASAPRPAVAPEPPRASEGAPAGQGAEVLSPVGAVLEEVPTADPNTSVAPTTCVSMEEVEWASPDAETAPETASGASSKGARLGRDIVRAARGAGASALAGTRFLTSLTSSSSRRFVGAVGKRPALAGLATVFVALPLILLAFWGRSGDAQPLPQQEVDAVAKARRQVVGLLADGRRLLDAGDAAGAAGKLRQADLLFPTALDVDRPRMILVAEREVDRLARLEETSQEAHLAIARADFAGARRSIDRLVELEAPAETLASAQNALAQARRRARRPRPQPAPEPELPRPRVVQAVPEPVLSAPRRPAPTGPGELRIDFSSARSRGVLTVFANDTQVLNRRYRFVEKKNFLIRKGVSGSFQESLELPPGVTRLKLYLTQPRKPTQHRPLQIEIEPGSSRTLRLRVNDQGKLLVGSS